MKKTIIALALLSLFSVACQSELPEIKECKEQCFKYNMEYYHIDSVTGNYGMIRCWCLDKDTKPVEIPLPSRMRG